MINLDRVVEIQPSVGSVVTHEVTFEGGFIVGFTDRFASLIEQRVALTGGKFSLEASDLSRYLNTLLLVRVEAANDLKPSIPRNIAKLLNVPALYQLALTNIGWVQDEDTKEIFIPKYTPKQEEVMEASEAIEFSQKLGLLSDYGIEINPGLSLEKKGNLNFMTWTVLKNAVTQTKEYWREDKRAPASDALLLSFFEIHQLENVIRPKFYYGNQTYYDRLLETLLGDACRKVAK
jgi:hypothetical protein